MLDGMSGFVTRDAYSAYSRRITDRIRKRYRIVRRIEIIGERSAYCGDFMSLSPSLSKNLRTYPCADIPDELSIRLYCPNTVCTFTDAIIPNSKNGRNKHIVIPYSKYAGSVNRSENTITTPFGVFFTLALYHLNRLL